MKKLLIILISILAVYSCKKELKSIQLDSDEIIIHYDESSKLGVSYSPLDVDIPPIFTWFSENTKVAEVDQNGLVEGVRIGETDILVQAEDAKFQAACKVVVEPISNLYKEPIVEFGQSMSFVKDKETRSISAETSKAIIYEGENREVKYVMYLFEYDRLNGAMVLLISSVMEEAGTFLKERYEFVVNLDGVLFYRINPNVVAGLSYHNELGLNVLYMEYSGMKSANSMYEQFNQRVKDFQ